MEVRNRFKGLDLIDRVPEELWTEISDIVQEAVIKTIPKKKKCTKAKGVSEEALQIAEKRREAKGKVEKERYTHLNAESQRIASRDKKGFLSDQCKEIEERNRMGKTRDLLKKIRDTKGTFHAKMSTIKDRNGMKLTEAEDIKKRWQEYTEYSLNCLEYSLEGLILKLQHFGHLIRRADSLEKSLMLGKIEGKRQSGQKRMR